MTSDLALSIILPVYNAESTLAAQVARVLEVAPEITARFEVLIVDDGSTDHTGEAAHDLAIEFPQLRVVRHARHRGPAAAARTGASSARGEIAFIYEGRSPLKASDLPQLWESSHSSNPPRALRTDEGVAIEAQLVEDSANSRAIAGRSRVRALRDEGRVGPPAAKITPRRRARQPH